MKTLRLCVLLLCAMVCFSSLAQNNYTDYQKADVIFSDQLDKAEGWKLRGYEISAGWLLSKNPTGNSAAHAFTFDESKDFELEVTAFMGRDAKASAPSIAFGDYLVTVICKNAFGSCGGTSIRVYNKPNLIKMDKANPIWAFPEMRYKIANEFPYEMTGPNPILVTFRKVKDRVYIFFDKTLVAQAPYIKFSTEALVFMMVRSIDAVTIHYITKTSTELIAEKGVTSQVVQPVTTGPVGVKPGGKYYGLFIGVSNYQDSRLNLNQPSDDAKKLKDLLTSRYTFTDSTTFLILNPTRQKLISELFRLRKIIGTNDNLLIFYAGHGYWDEAAQQGYWWPVDASPNDPSNWLSNSDVREQIRSIKSGHTLLISDACFSGGIFKTRSANTLRDAGLDIQFLYKMPSRRAITSGTMTAVPDKSVFLEYLTKRLQENQEPFLTSQQLFDSFRMAVINNSMVVPQDGVIAETGDEGGDFVFIRRK
jgi:hypothetical protein